MWIVPVTRNSSDSSRGSDSRLPSSKAAASGARSGERLRRNTSTPPSRRRSIQTSGDHAEGRDSTRTHVAAWALTTERHRSDLARSRKSNSSGFSGDGGRRPRPSTRTRQPAVISGGSPSMMSDARPEAGCHAAPRRMARTATTHSLDGRCIAACTAAVRSGSMTEADSLRGDSSTIPSIATGCGDDDRLHARSSHGNRFD